MDNLTRILAGYAASLSYDELPAEVVQVARKHLVDTVGCAIGGFDCVPAAIGRRLVGGGAPELYSGRILGSGVRASAEGASFVNTAMIRNLDFNDGYVGGHPSDCLGALLALAEAAGADGRRLLTAMAVAYEIVLRLQDAGQLRQRGWDQGFGVGIATAAAVGNLFGFGRDRIADGIAITAVANVPLRATRAGQLSLWKGAATAFAVRNGVFGMLLAAEGMTGPERPFEGRHGLWEQITGPFELGELGGRGGEFRLPAAHLKYWPVEGNAQAAIWAAREIRERVKVDEIESLAISTYWSAWHEIASEPEKWDPRTRETADHSLPYIFARALVDGTIDLATFDEQAYLEPTLRPLMARIKASVDDSIEAVFPEQMVMRVVVTTKQGGSHTVEVRNPLGHPLNRMQDEDVSAKFTGLAGPAYGEARAKVLLERWWDVGDMAGLKEALDLLNC